MEYKQDSHSGHSGANEPRQPTPFVPPPIIPSAGMENAHADQPRSIRSWVILICCAWGFIFGFLYHITREPAPKKNPVAVAPPPTKSPDLEETTPVAKPQTPESAIAAAAAQKVQSLATDPSAPNTTKLIEQMEDNGHSIATPTPEAKQTNAIALPRMVLGGLTGQNVSAPHFEAAVTPKAASTKVKTPQPAKKQEAPRSAFDGPELEP